MAWFIEALIVSDGIEATSCVASDPPAYAGGLYWGAVIQALSVSDGSDATSCVASDPPAYAGGFYWERS
jgi:hypothetical protein